MRAICAQLLLGKQRGILKKILRPTALNPGANTGQFSQSAATSLTTLSLFIYSVHLHDKYYSSASLCAEKHKADILYLRFTDDPTCLDEK